MNELHLDPHSPLHRPREQRTDPQQVAEAFGDPSARLVVIDVDGAHCVERPTGEWRPEQHILLGTSAGQDAGMEDPREHIWFAVRGQVEGPGLRDRALKPLMHDVVTAGAAVLAWHDTKPRCERCGGLTQPWGGGFVRVCQDCGAQLFPRHDPAIIVAIIDGHDRLLLAHQRSWPSGRVSVLAGFVEAGEAIEQTAAREVIEEVGLRLASVRYLVSQAWPFPRSLMLAMVARAEGEPTPDGVEIEWARWFTRQCYRAGVEAGELSPPGTSSIGGRLIRAWLAGELPAPEQSS